MHSSRAETRIRSSSRPLPIPTCFDQLKRKEAGQFSAVPNTETCRLRLDSSNWWRDQWGQGKIKAYWDFIDYRGAQPFWVKGHSVLLLVNSKIMIWTFESQIWKTVNLKHLTKLFGAFCLILLPLDLFRIVIRCKLFNTSMKF